MSGESITFRRGVPFLVLVLILGVVEATGTRLLRYAWDSGPTIPIVDSNLIAAASSLLILGLVWHILHREDVTHLNIGLSAELIVPAAVTVGGYFLVLNLIGAGLAIGSGNAETIGYHWTVSPPVAIIVFFWMVLIAGLVEEFIFRGYIQTKCISLLGSEQHIRIAVGIIIASMLFSAYHIPRILTDGPPGTMEPFEYLLLLAVNGLAYGLLYEWTHNLFVPILVHAAGNMPGTAGILFFTTTDWPTIAIVGYNIASLALIISMILFYRRWAFTTDRMPVWTHRTVSIQ